MSEPTRTPLHEKLESMGAGFNEDGGWLWMTTLGDVMKEYEAVREDVGVWDLSPLIKWTFEGPDAVAAADWVNTNDMGSLKIGGVRYGPFLNAGGGVVDDGTVFKVRDDFLFVMTNSEEHAPYWEENLSRFDVVVTNVTREMPHLAIQGPRSREVVQGLTDVDVSELRYFGFIPEQVMLGGARGWLARTGFSGELGFEFFTDPDDVLKAWEAVVENAGVTPFGVSAIYILRLEAGLIIQGVDYDVGETNPFDVGLGRFVRMDKGDFLGRVAIEAVAADPPNRYRTLVIEGGLPEAGASVTKESRDIGVVRCSIESPRFGNIAGARIARDHAGEGTEVEVGGRKATVRPWGIYDPERRRPRS